jgi:hypothetical protein
MRDWIQELYLQDEACLFRKRHSHSYSYSYCNICTTRITTTKFECTSLACLLARLLVWFDRYRLIRECSHLGSIRFDSKCCSFLDTIKIGKRRVYVHVHVCFYCERRAIQSSVDDDLLDAKPATLVQGRARQGRAGQGRAGQGKRFM